MPVTLSCNKKEAVNNVTAVIRIRTAVILSILKTDFINKHNYLSARRITENNISVL
jgi:hypothetical protein